ncbi:hypothetical protein NECAME_05814 [Necator americanus]|uniref:Uncharacterized protein n=1 Tax=Necator americanus TaxID=51031 RepID=W2U0K0_NECAM|nr:hypothetical protein NECAME_05814 [Necator americanus]ETN86822.1 hypothetical protein NECAME_05814 [Necator americanus]
MKLKESRPFEVTVPDEYAATVQGRGRSEHVRKGRTPRGYKGKSEDSSIRTARAQTPKQKSDGLKFDATFRVNDQETNELHTLIIKADIQGKKIKKLIMNGKTCKCRKNIELQGLMKYRKKT